MSEVTWQLTYGSIEVIPKRKVSDACRKVVDGRDVVISQREMSDAGREVLQVLIEELSELKMGSSHGKESQFRRGTLEIHTQSPGFIMGGNLLHGGNLEFHAGADVVIEAMVAILVDEGESEERLVIQQGREVGVC